MNFYKIHYLSLIRFLNTQAEVISTVTGKSAPVVMNFDAHTNITELPMQDMIGTIGFGLTKSNKIITVHTGIAVSTYDDPDILRHMDMMDVLSKALDADSRIPLFTAQSGVAVETNWMVTKTGLIVEPCDQSKLRTLQVMTVQFQSGVSGQA